MTVHIDLSIWELLFWIALLFLAAIGVTVLAAASVLPACDKWLTARVLGRAERIAEYEAAIAAPHQLQPATPEPEVVAEPQVHVGQVIVRRKEEDLLPPPSAVSHGEAPLFDTLAMPLPPFDIDYGFVFGAPSWSAQTGVFPVIEEPEPKARERFATPPPKTRSKRKPSVKVTVGDEVRQAELAEAATA